MKPTNYRKSEVSTARNNFQPGRPTHPLDSAQEKSRESSDRMLLSKKTNSLAQYIVRSICPYIHRHKHVQTYFVLATCLIP